MCMASPKGILYFQRRRNEISLTLVLGGENTFLDYGVRRSFPLLFTFYFMVISLLPFQSCSEFQ